MAFGGWPEEALEFFDGLAADNSRAYWTAHQAVYRDKVLGPMTELVDELAAEAGPDAGPVKIFRPYRDVRFSRDKSPYQTHIAATVGGGYIQLSARGLAAGAGSYQMTPVQLGRYRQAVVSELAGGELESVVADLEREGIEVTAHQELKTAPRGYPAEHPRIRLLRYKGIIAWQQWPVQPWLETPEAKDRVAGFLRRARPLAGWLAAYVDGAE
jgi:uncharacterized protein (TIGR02453 family)